MKGELVNKNSNAIVKKNPIIPIWTYGFIYRPSTKNLAKSVKNNVGCRFVHERCEYSQGSRERKPYVK